MSRITFLIFCLLTFAFSVWLMFHTLSYDEKNSQILIASKAWSDFGGHLPLIRSFTYGNNFPPQNPLYPGEPIRYHFLFYALSGWLEQLGLRIDLAVNLLSISGFFGMLLLIYALAMHYFKSRTVAILSVIFLLFNGSLSFVRYFDKHGISLESVIAIKNISAYPSFGPWDGSLVGAFWNLNIFTNQRHLAPSIALSLLAIYLLTFSKPGTSPTTKLKIGLYVGLVVGILSLLNQAIFACLIVFLFWHFIFEPHSRLSLVSSAITSLPIYLYSSTLVHIDIARGLTIDPGFLISKANFNFREFLVYWFHNLGLHLLLLPIGIFISPKSFRWLAFPLLTLFFIGNYFRLSPDMFNNHKLFNFISIFIHMYSALVIAKLYQNKLLWPFVPLLTLLLVLSGIIDFFALKNDTRGGVSDTSKNPDIKFFLTRTQPHDIILNSTWFYHPASLAGRSIYSGYTYFTWSHGYNQTQREASLVSIYEASSKNIACNLLKEKNIAYVELRDKPEDYLHPNWLVWDQFVPVYKNPSSSLRIYSVAQNCP